jgi:predicted ATPase/DNA-binding CsgD family transcriptional regulator/TolA-binding protein
MPAIDAVAKPHSHLPTHLTSLVGREREVAAICELLRRDDVRILTLTGAPGIGKTRLGIEVATRLLDYFVDGSYFVNLAAVTDPDAVVRTIATAVGIRQIGDQSLEELLSRLLSSKQVLLLLDNFEQVLAAGPMVAQLLKVAPGPKVLATSREVLRLSGEYDFPVPPLALPPVLTEQGHSGRYTPLPLEHITDYEAVQLFVQRAAAYKPDFTLGVENTYAIAAICRKLDGLPLAIELAAARIRHLSPQAILDRLQDRLGLLTSGARDLPLRQRTLRATIEWSYSLLSEEEKRLFRRLAVFRGGRTLEAVEAVCNPGVREQESVTEGSTQDAARSNSTSETPDTRPLAPLGIEPLNGIASLVDKSLLSAREGPRPGFPASAREATGMIRKNERPEVVSETRYFMLETLHEYAKEKLEESGEAQDLQKAHALYFTELAERAEPKLHGPQQVEWLDRLESEQDNLQAALTWARANDLDIGLRLVATLNIYWNRRGYLIEGRDWASDMISRARERGVKAQVPGVSHGPSDSMARALYTLGFIAFRQANYLSAHELLAESVQTYEELQSTGDRGLRLGTVDSGRETDRGDTTGLVESLNILGIVTSRLENMQARRRLHEQALELAQRSGDGWSIARSLYQLGHVARLTGDYDLGRSLFGESLTLFKESGDNFNIGLALIGLGQMAERQGDYQSARRLFEESLSVYKELGDKWGIAGTLYCLGCAYIGLKDYESARATLEEEVALAEELGATGDIAEALIKLGRAAFLQNDYAGAHLLYERSLALFEALKDKMGIALCLMNLAGIVIAATPVTESQAEGKETAETALRSAAVSAASLLGTTQALMETVGFQLEPEDREWFSQYAHEVRNQLGEETFAEAWAEGQAMPIEQAIVNAQTIPAPPAPAGKALGEASPTHATIGADFGGLTRREREVAALVTQGKSNRQIAAELVVSERTVEGHINKILSKLGFRSRAQVAAWTVEKGLVELSK